MCSWQVKWLGYDMDQCTWEPVWGIPPDVVLAYEDQVMTVSAEKSASERDPGLLPLSTIQPEALAFSLVPPSVVEHCTGAVLHKCARRMCFNLEIRVGEVCCELIMLAQFHLKTIAVSRARRQDRECILFIQVSRGSLKGGCRCVYSNHPKHEAMLLELRSSLALGLGSLDVADELLERLSGDALGALKRQAYDDNDLAILLNVCVPRVKPSARSQVREANTPMARETPKSTV